MESSGEKARESRTSTITTMSPTGITMEDVFPAPAMRSQSLETVITKTRPSRSRSPVVMPVSIKNSLRRRSDTLYTTGLPSPLDSIAHMTPAQQADMQSKWRLRYYDSIYNDQQRGATAEERAARQAMITVDIQLNTKIDEPQVLLQHLSLRFSEIYQRSESFIVTSIRTQAVLFGGSPEPAYIADVTALGSLFGPQRNQRTAGVIYRIMEQNLNIAPSRGLIHFIPTATQNLSTNKKTVYEEIRTVEQREEAEVEAIRGFMKSRKKAKERFASLKDRIKTSQKASLRRQWRSSTDTAEASSVEEPEEKRRSLLDVFGLSQRF